MLTGPKTGEKAMIIAIKPAMNLRGIRISLFLILNEVTANHYTDAIPHI